MSEVYALGLDLGTSSMKGILMSEEGSVVASSKKPVKPYYPEPGWAESDPEVWWEAACSISREMLQATGISAECVKCIGFDAPAAGLIPMSSEGKLYNDIIWLDTRAVEEAEEINQILQQKGIDRTFTGKDSLPRLPWLRRNRPDIYEKIDFILEDVGYLVYKATGEIVTPAQSGCFFNGDESGTGWDYRISDALNIPREWFPRMVDAADVVGGLSHAAAEQLGLCEGIPVVGGFTDIQAGELGSGCVTEGDASIYIGTSAIVTITTNKEITAPLVDILKSANKKYDIVMNTADSAGGSIDWMMGAIFENEQRMLGDQGTYALINEGVAKIAPGAEGLMFTPWLYGERAPLDEYVRGNFINITPIHGRLHMARAVYESIAFHLRWIFSIAEEAYGEEFEAIQLSGGVTVSKPLMQIIADVFGRPVKVPTSSNMAVAKGSALLALIGSGYVPSFEEAKKLNGEMDIYMPSFEQLPLYEKNYLNFKQLYEVLKGFYRHING